MRRLDSSITRSFPTVTRPTASSHPRCNRGSNGLPSRGTACARYGSEFFVFLASPEAAASVWCGREAERWRATKPTEKLLIGLTDGDLVWNDAANDFDWTRTNALPDVLRGAFAEEPRYIDLRW